MEQNLNRYFLLQNIPGLNPKAVCSIFVVKTCVLLAIRPSDGDVKPDAPRLVRWMGTLILTVHDSSVGWGR